jgi:hypothetical protein
MALLDRDAGIIVTAAPGTGSTSLIAALRTARGAVAVPPLDGTHVVEGVDAKHGTVGQLVAAGLLPADHGLRIVTTTRNPFDFYVAEWQRTRTRWVEELRDPRSWVHAQPGAVDRIVDAVTLDFEAWLRKALDVRGDEAPPPRRINRSHVEEADVVLRMEALAADLEALVGLAVAVPRDNVTERDRAYWRHYGAEARHRVEVAHAVDLARFGYRF